MKKKTKTKKTEPVAEMIGVFVPYVPHEEAQAAADWVNDFCAENGIDAADKDRLFQCVVTVFVRGLIRGN